MTNSSRTRRATALAAVVVLAAAALPPGTASAAPSWASAATATVSTMSPALGDSAGGTLVQILGTGLLHTVDVTFGGVPAQRVVPVTDTRLYAVTPAGPVGGSVPVAVTTDSGTVIAGRYSYRLKLVPEFGSLPASAAGSTRFRVTVRGATVGASLSAFNALRITARVGGLPARVTWVNESTLEVTVPATPRATAASLQLFQNGFGGPVSTETVDYFPAIVSVTSSKVSTEGGATVKIAGVGFLSVDETDPAAVTFGGVPATSFRVVSAIQIVAEVPPGADGPAAVRVTTPGGASPESARALVTYRPALGIDTSGDLALRGGGGAMLLTVTGGTLGADAKGFVGRSVIVVLGGRRLAATYVDPTHLRVSAPATTAASATLRVVNDTIPGPEATVAVAPSVIGLSAAVDTVAGGKTVTVRVAGPAAAGATDFRFGDNPADCERNGVTLSFVCVVPPASQAGPVRVSFTSGSGTASRFSAPATFSYTDID